MTLLYLGVQDSLREYYLPDGRVSESLLARYIDKFRSNYPSHPHLS